MPVFFHKPENALKRASEFIDVGKEESALEVLNDIIRSRKHRHKWTSTHEDIMLLFTKLCVQLQRSLFAKDGLYQYRNICKEVAPHSFEKVVNSFLALAEEKAGQAREESEATVLQDVDDLDIVVTPESLLLSTVSGEGAKERTDRVLLTPWVKFLWESYRNMLELLKNNPTSLPVYTEVARKAFEFCINYQRRTEYRKLCEILRNHLVQAEKYQSQAHSLKLDQPENIQFLVDVRFKQLESSIAVDLWQEAFRAIEEIQKLLSISGKAPKASLLENFYSRQAKVYMMAKNQLFHAAALHKLFVLRKEQKKTLTKEEEQITASQVLLATLCIPIEPVPSETDRFLEVDDNSRDKAQRLATLLRMTTPPTRASLMKDVLKHNVLHLLPAKLQQLYQYLEVEFNPLRLCRNVMPILDVLEQQEHCKQYVELLKGVTLVRLIKQVSQVYESIKLSKLVELAPLVTTTQLEKVVVETASSNNIQVRIDHRTKSLCFGADLNLSYKSETPEGAHIQSMPSDVLCHQLTSITHALQQAVCIISASEIRAEHLEATKRTYQDYQVHCRGDHRKAVQRSQEIENRKEFIESRNKAKEKKVEDERRKKEVKERQEEQNRLNREAEERERERRRKELEEMQLKINQEKVDAFKNTAVGKRAFADFTKEDLKGKDTDYIFSKQLKQIEKEKRDKEIKLKTQEKKVDYFERAKRLEELHLLEKQYQEQREADRRFHKEQEEQKVAVAIKERREAEEASVRLKVMREDEAKFCKSLETRRRAQLLRSQAEFEEKLNAARAVCLATRRRERIQRRKAEDAVSRKEEAARLALQKREEEEKRMEEEKRKKEDEREELRQRMIRRDEKAEEKIRQRDQKMLEERKERDRIPFKSDNAGHDWRKNASEPEVEVKESTAPQAYCPPGRGGSNMDERESHWRDKQRDARDNYDRRGVQQRGEESYRGMDWRGGGSQSHDREGLSWRGGGGQNENDRSPRPGYDGNRRRGEDNESDSFDRRDRDGRDYGREDWRDRGRRSSPGRDDRGYRKEGDSWRGFRGGQDSGDNWRRTGERDGGGERRLRVDNRDTSWRSENSPGYGDRTYSLSSRQGEPDRRQSSPRRADQGRRYESSRYGDRDIRHDSSPRRGDRDTQYDSSPRQSDRGWRSDKKEGPPPRRGDEEGFVEVVPRRR